jgi:hypothetical protein
MNDSNKKAVKIYHYTKCNRINSIFEDGFIATEMRRTLSDAPKCTDFVWLTEKLSYPKTALPYLSMFPETSLINHIQYKGIAVDLDKIGNIFGNFYRFSFDSTDNRLKKWFFCQERTVARLSNHWIRMESVANKVGDDIRAFWISNEDLALENFSLEVFDGSWKMLLKNTSLSNLKAAEVNVIDNLRAKSVIFCDKFNIPHSHLTTA